MKTYIKYSVIIALLFLSDLEGMCFSLDSLSQTNESYDSIVSFEVDNFNDLFYKHKSDLLLNNVGPFGSKHYFSSTRYLFDVEEPTFSKSFYTPIKALHGVKPFTNIKYVNASRKEQLFKISHIQKFGEQISLYFDWDKVNSTGAFLNQQTSVSLFNAELAFKSKDDRYEVVFTNLIQRDFFEENGGLDSVENYQNQIYTSEQAYQVNLNSSNSFVKRVDFGLMQRLDIWRFGSDSIAGGKLFLKHQYHYSPGQKVFYDNEPTSKVFNDLFIDSILSIDSIYNRINSNDLSLGFDLGRLESKVQFSYDLIDYYQSFGLDTSYYSSFIGIVEQYSFSNNRIKIKFKYGVDGYRSGDLSSDLTFTKNAKKYSLSFKGGYKLAEPDLKYVNYSSNHFDWKNYNLSKEGIGFMNINLDLTSLKLNFSADIKVIEGALYFDSLAQASQYEESLLLSTFSLGKDYRFWRFHFRTAITYQTTSNTIIAPLPELSARQIMYYEKKIFKKAMKLQFGVGFSYSTDYYGYNYMPGLREFYVQERTVLGYYPSIDVFLNTHLRKAQIFLKYEHINAGGSLEKSYLVAGYPQLNKSLKFGVSWNLFD